MKNRMKDQMNNIILVILLFSLILSMIKLSQISATSQKNIYLGEYENPSFRTSKLEGTVAIIQDISPGNYPGLELKDILDDHSISYTFFRSNDLGTLDLTLYDKVIISGNQPLGFAANITLEITSLEDYATNGGYILMMPDNDSFVDLPGGGMYSNAPSDEVVIIDDTHPIVTTPNLINETDLQNLGPSAAGFIFSIPGNPHLIMNNGVSAPIITEFDFGLGNIMISTLPLERIHGTGISPLFENAVLFTPELTEGVIPNVSSPNDIDMEEGSIGNFIKWTPTDRYPGNYRILQNGTQVKQDIWFNNIELQFSIDVLSVGTYLFEIRVTDLAGNEASDSVVVRVIDSLKPVISLPNDISYEFGSTNYNITWIATDNDPANFSIYRNNQQINNGSWTSGQPITVNIDGLSLGNYSFVLIAEDGSGNDFDNEVLVNVVDTIKPTGSGPKDFEIKIGTEGVFLNWTIDDLLPNKYTLFENETLVAEGEWAVDNNVLFELTDMELGHNLYVLKANDTSGNEFVDQVNVTVIPSDFYISSPSDIFYLEGKRGHSITWITNSLDPWYFIITSNDEVIRNETWMNDIITIDVDDLKPGDYNFTLELHSKKDKILSDSVLTRVFPDLITITPDVTTDNSDFFDRIFETDNRFLIGGAVAITVIGGISFYTRRR